MAIQINESQLKSIVASVIKEALNEWQDFTMPSLSKNDKVRAAQNAAETKFPGNGYHYNDSVWGNRLKHGGGKDKFSQKTLLFILRDMAHGDEKALKQFGKIYQNNEEVRKAVEDGLFGIAGKHILDFNDWNQTAE